MSLVPQKILRIAQLSFGPEVLVPNSSNATYVRDANGRTWIRREGALMGDNGILAEALWWLLASSFDIPTPQAAYHCDSNDDGWLSRRIEEVVHWRPSRASYLINVDGLGGVLALDAITGNGDRHPRNLLLETISESRMCAWAIDAANAAIGRVTPGALATAHALTCASSAILSEVVDEACNLGRADLSERTRLLDALRARCAVAPQITKGYLTKLGSLTP